jgi:glycosyltransferase involved in cell wall biosynthesis
LESQATSGRVALIHNHGLWMMPNVYCSWAAESGRVPLVVSPHGMLRPRAFRGGSFAKRLFWPLLQRPALQGAACFHATAESEAVDIRTYGLFQPVAVIPNGVDVPELQPTEKPPDRVLLFLGRLHAIKGLDMLLAAWQREESRFPEWRLVVAGPDERGPGRKMRRLADDLGLRRVRFVGVLYGQEKWRAYREADLFVLPTLSENFGMTVAEALAAGTPAIVSKGAPWCGLDEHGAGWWVEIGVEPLVAALETALSRSREDLEDMGRRGRAWVEKDFSWDVVGAQMVGTYRWLVDCGDTPPWVRS